MLPATKSFSFSVNIRTVCESWRKNCPFWILIAGAKTLEEKVGLPPKPKKPLTPYFRYMKQIRPTIIAENPQATIIDVVKVASKQWGNLDQKIKQKLQDEYKEDQIVYIESKTKYDNKITEKQKSEIRQLKQEIAEAKERKVIKKRVKELGRPKKPSSAFLKFLVEERKKTPQTSSETYKEWHRKMVNKWAQMSDSEKTPFMDSARKELETYRKDMLVWEEKMIRLGHVDVVRHEALIDPTEPAMKIK